MDWVGEEYTLYGEWWDFVIGVCCVYVWYDLFVMYMGIV